jgi:hypothetical protein
MSNSDDPGDRRHDKRSMTANQFVHSSDATESTVCDDEPPNTYSALVGSGSSGGVR